MEAWDSEVRRESMKKYEKKLDKIDRIIVRMVNEEEKETRK